MMPAVDTWTVVEPSSGKGNAFMMVFAVIALQHQMYGERVLSDLKWPDTSSNIPFGLPIVKFKKWEKNVYFLLEWVFFNKNLSRQLTS